MTSTGSKLRPQSYMAYNPTLASDRLLLSENVKIVVLDKTHKFINGIAGSGREFQVFTLRQKELFTRREDPLVCFCR